MNLGIFSDHDSTHKKDDNSLLFEFFIIVNFSRIESTRASITRLLWSSAFTVNEL